MKRNITILLLITLSISLSSKPLEITEQIAVDLAIKNNIELQKQKLTENSALLDKKGSYNVFFPKTTTNGVLSHANSVSPVTGYDSANNYHYSIEPDPFTMILGFETSLYLTPAQIDGIKLLNSNYRLETLVSEKKELEVIRDIKKSFYTLILLKEQISLYQYNHDELEKRYMQLQKNYNNGFIDELQLLEVQVALENFKPQLENLKELYSISIKNFKINTGLKDEDEIKIVGSIKTGETTYNKESLLNTAVNSGLDFKVLNQNIELLDQQIKLKRHTAFYPVLGISYSVSRPINDPFNNSIFDEDNYQDDKGNFNIFLNMDLTPLLPNSKERVEIKKLKNSKEIALLSKKQLRDGLDIQLTQKLQALNNSVELQESLEKTVSLAQKRVRLTVDAYNQGSKEVLEVESAENELRKAQLELLNEKYNYLISIFDINYIIGEGR